MDLIICVGEMSNFLGSVLLQQKFETTDIPVLWLSFIWQAKENASWRNEGRPTQKTQREESEKVGLKLKDPNIRKTKIMGWYSHFFQNFPQFIVIHTVKGSGIVNKAEIDVFPELSCFFHDPADVGNLISGSSAFSKTSLNIREFMVHVLLKPALEDF